MSTTSSGRARAVAEVSLSAIQANLAVVRDAAPQSKVMAVIKADAYGHGALHVAHALMDADAFAVATVDEALALRWGGIQKDIVVLEGFLSDEELLSCVDHGLIPTLHSPEQIDCLQNNADHLRALSCWLKFDTGMQRLGLPASAIFDAISALDSLGVSLIGLMSHLANADNPAHELNALQIDRFNAVRNQFLTRFPQRPIAGSLANSAGILKLKDSHFDWVRPGIMLYGSSPVVGETAAELGLFPAMSLRAKLISIRKVPQGQGVGYGSDWLAMRDSVIGICALGYADGYLRSAQNAEVEVAGQRVAICGRVSMDMTAIDLTDVAARVGDWVSFWGQGPTVDEVAEKAGTIGYELLSGLGARVEVGYQ